VLWPGGAQLLIRFTGPELWWVLRVADWAARVPAATVPVPAGVPGVLAVGAVTGLALLLARLLWRWRWFRAAAGPAGAAAVICALAWSLSGVVGP
jgi:competence protein ComEC